MECFLLTKTLLMLHYLQMRVGYPLPEVRWPKTGRSDWGTRDTGVKIVATLVLTPMPPRPIGANLNVLVRSSHRDGMIVAR